MNAVHILGSLMLMTTTASGTGAPCSAGATEFQKRHFDSAQELLWQCVLSQERDAQSAVNLSLTYRELKNYDDGRQRVDKARQQLPENEDLRYLSAYLYFKTQQYSLSMAELSAAYRVKPDDWRLHQLFALNFTEQKNLSYAEQEFLRAIKLNPTNPELYYQLGRLYYIWERFREAIDSYNHALRLAPEYEEAYDNLGLSYQALRDMPHAVASYSRAINLATKNGIADAWPYINYASLLEEQSPNSAIPLLEQAISIEPQNAEAHYQMGRALRLVNRTKEAQSFFEKTIAIDASFDLAYYALARLLRTENPQRSADLLQTFQRLQRAHSIRQATDSTDPPTPE